MLSAIKEYFRNIHFRGNIYVTTILNLLVVYGLFTVCRIVFYLFNIRYFPEVSFFHFFRMLLGGLKFDTLSILYTNLLYLLLMFLPFTFRYNNYYQTFLKYLFYVTNSVAIAANCIDLVYFRFTLRRTTASIFREFQHETNFGSLLPQFVIDYWYVPLMWIILSIVLILSYRKAKIIRQPKGLWYQIVYTFNGLILLVLLSGLIVGGLRGGFRHSTRPITLSNAGEFVNKPLEVAIVLNTPFSIYKTLEIKPFPRIGYFDDENELEKTYTPIHRPNPTEGFRPMNVVVIILESFGREYIGKYNPHLKANGYQGYTPFLDSLIEHSLMFRYSFSNGRKSIDALPSVLSSIPMMVEPYITSHYSTNKINSFATLLKPKGYHTSFFHGAPNGSMGHLAFTRIAGFDHYYGMTEYGNNKDFDGMWGIWDEEFFQFFVQSINGFPQPFFTSIFSVTSHHPFRVPEMYKGKFPEGTHPIHPCIGYTDYALRKFFDAAAKMPWFENTLFVITADHPFHSSYAEYNTSIGGFAVPIVFYSPKGDLKGESNRPAQHIDILPTVLDYLNFDRPFVGFGKSLFDEETPDFAITYTNSVYQLIYKDNLLFSDGEKTIGIFSYETDPLLEKNILNEASEAENMEKFLKALIQQYNNRMIDDRLLAE